MATLDTKDQSSSMCVAASESAGEAREELRLRDATDLKAERDALREQLLRVRNEAAAQLRRVTAQLEAAELEREHMAAEITLLKKADIERARLRRWIEDIEQELCSAQGRLHELESRIEGLSGLNARLSLERAELRARLDSLSDTDFSQAGEPRAAVAMQRRLSQLEAELTRLIAKDALHQESTEEVRSLRAQLDTAKSRQEELENEMHRMCEALTASQDATADKATELDLLRDFMEHGPQEDADVQVDADGSRRAADALEAEIRRVKEDLKLTRLGASEERAALYGDLRKVERAASEATAARDRQAAMIDRLLAERGAAKREAAAVREELRAIEWARAETQQSVNRLEAELSESKRMQAELAAALETERERTRVAESKKSEA